MFVEKMVKYQFVQESVGIPVFCKLKIEQKFVDLCYDMYGKIVNNIT